MADFFYIKGQDKYVKAIISSYEDDDPRHWESNLGTFITFEDEYESPDNNNFESFEGMMEFFGGQYTNNRDNDLQNLVKNADTNGYILIPVFRYRTFEEDVTYMACPNCRNPFINDGFDSGLIGVIYASKDDIKKRFNGLNEDILEKAKKGLIDEVENYTRWLNIDGIYDVVIYDGNGKIEKRINNVWADKDKLDDTRHVAATVNNIDENDLVELKGTDIETVIFNHKI